MMASDKTVVQLCNELSRVTDCDGESVDEVDYLADLIVDSHKRQIAELRECLKEAINIKCKCCGSIVYEGETDISKPMSFTGESKCGKIDGTCFVQKWRKAMEG